MELPVNAKAFGNRNSIKAMNLTLQELTNIRDRINSVIEQKLAEEEAEKVEKAIQALHDLGVEIPQELLDKQSARPAETKPKSEPVLFVVGDKEFTERAQGKPSKDFQIAIDEYNSLNNTTHKKSYFKQG